MTDISTLNSGQSFTVTKHIYNKDVSKMSLLDQTKELKKGEAIVQGQFGRAEDNGKVDILIANDTGAAVISGRKISLTELGKAAPEIALEMKQFDANGDNYIEEAELKVSTSQYLKESAIAVGASTAGGAATGAGVGAWFAGIGALPGAAVGALVTGVPTLAWKAVAGFWSVGYKTPEWLR